MKAQFVVPPLGGIVWRHGMDPRLTIPPKGGTTSRFSEEFYDPKTDDIDRDGLWLHSGLERVWIDRRQARRLADRRRRFAAHRLAAGRTNYHDGQRQGHEAALEDQAR